MSERKKEHPAQVFVWWVTGIGLLLAGAWAVFVHFNPKDSKRMDGSGSPLVGATNEPPNPNAVIETRSPKPPPPFAINDAWVKLWDDKHFKDRTLTVRYPATVKNMDDVKSDSGTHGYGDKASSVEWHVPPGWKAERWEHDTFRGKRYELRGTGKLERNGDLGGFGDETSSLSWEHSN